MKDIEIDRLLNIETRGLISKYLTDHNHGYQATDYEILDRIIDTQLINSNSVVVDYGCGKGRVEFYLQYKIGCKCIGVEYSHEIIQFAYSNLVSSKMSHIEFIECDAALYSVPDHADCFYFFNPFSSTILQKVLDHIIDSYYSHPRTIYLFFYYPDEEYIYLLMNTDEIYFYDSIDTRDLYGSNQEQECIMIFEIPK